MKPKEQNIGYCKNRSDRKGRSGFDCYAMMVVWMGLIFSPLKCSVLS